MRIRFSKKFKKKYKKLPSKIKSSCDKKISIFIENPNNIFLKNHSLVGKFQGLRSISITGDWRAIYEEKPDGEIIFLAIGSHSELYK